MSEEVLDEASTGAEVTPEQDVQEENIGSLDDLKALAGDDDEEIVEETTDEDVSAAGAEEVVDGEGDQTPPAEQYVPDYKLKAGGEEIEIPEVFRAAITSKEAEEQFKEVFRKAHGLPIVEESRDKYKEDFGTVSNALTQQTNTINVLDGYLKQKDFTSFFDALEVPKQDVMQWVLQQVQMQEWTPEQKQAYEAQREDKRRAEIYQEGYNSQEQRLQNLTQDGVVRDYEFELLSNKDAKSFQEQFDEKRGHLAFEKEVAELGERYEISTGRIMPIPQLVKEVMDKYSAFMPQSQQQTVETAATPAPGVQQPKELPVIPNTGPSGRAPTHKAITSIEDLEKIADSL